MLDFRDMEAVLSGDCVAIKRLNSNGRVVAAGCIPFERINIADRGEMSVEASMSRIPYYPSLESPGKFCSTESAKLKSNLRSRSLITFTSGMGLSFYLRSFLDTVGIHSFKIQLRRREA